MRLVSIDSKILKKYTKDPEMLQKSNRPCALVLRLKYRNEQFDFAIPLRSNISPSTPKNQYFPLPTRHTTKDGYRHGIHYIKMFPIDRTKTYKFNTDSMYYSMLKAILDKNEKKIIKRCQNVGSPLLWQSRIRMTNILRICTPSAAEVKHTNTSYSNRDVQFVLKIYHTGV